MEGFLEPLTESFCSFVVAVEIVQSTVTNRNPSRQRNKTRNRRASVDNLSGPVAFISDVLDLDQPS